MDFEKWIKAIGLDGIELSADQKNNLKKEFESKQKLEADKTKFELQATKLNSDLEFQKEESKKAFEKRDAISAEMKALQKQIDESGKNLDFKELYQEKKGKVSDLEKILGEKDNQIKSLGSEIEGLKSETTKIKEGRATELLSQLKEGSEARTFAESFKDDLEKLSKFVELNSKAGFSADQGSTGKFKIDLNKKYNEYSFAELDQLKKANASHYDKIKSEYENRNSNQ